MKKECNKPFSNTIGMCGSMGKAVALFWLYRDTNEEEWKIEAERLLDVIFEKCEINISLSYSDGLCGMGVGVEYFLQNNFVEGNADEILIDIDSLIINAINDRSPLDLSIESGILGLAYYLYYRLCYRINSEKPIVLKLKEQTIYLIDWIAEAMQDKSINKNYHEIYFILILLHQLNILNAKIEYMMHWCDKTLSTQKL